MTNPVVEAKRKHTELSCRSITKRQAAVLTKAFYRFFLARDHTHRSRNLATHPRSCGQSLLVVYVAAHFHSYCCCCCCCRCSRTHTWYLYREAQIHFMDAAADHVTKLIRRFYSIERFLEYPPALFFSRYIPGLEKALSLLLRHSIYKRDLTVRCCLIYGHSRVDGGHSLELFFRVAASRWCARLMRGVEQRWPLKQLIYWLAYSRNRVLASTLACTVWSLCPHESSFRV